MLLIRLGSTGKACCCGIFLLFLFLSAHAQGVAVNTTGASPDASAILDLSSTSQGFLLPRMSANQRVSISNASEGLMVFDTDHATPWTFSQGQWQQLVPIPGGSILWRTDRQDLLMAQAGFSFFTQQLIPNGQTLRAWNPTAPSTTNAPGARESAIGFWTGTEMLIWGGASGLSLSDGGLYNPASDSWRSMNNTGAPTGITGYASAGANAGFFIWGGSTGFSATNAGYFYNLNLDQWTHMTTTNAPSARANAASVWLGDKLMVWGGYVLDFLNPPPAVFNDGALYNPNTDSWTTTSPTNAPAGRQNPVMIYTGTEVMVWGGFDVNYAPLYDGAIYNPTTDTWSTMSSIGAPTNLQIYEAYLVNGKMIVFGQNSSTWEGAIYDPSTDSWSSMNMTGAPSDRVNYTVISTGTELILWGGRFTSTYLNDGGIYDLDSDSWSALGTTNAPLARGRHVAVWTGTEMLVFGGTDGSGVIEAPGSLSSPGNYIYYLYRKD